MGLAAILACATTPAGAATLAEALAATYQDNPTLTAARAQLRATDEQSAIARAAGRPTLGASAGYTKNPNGTQLTQSFDHAVTVGAQASLPIYQGGRVRSAVHAADARVDSGRQSLRASEGDVFVSAVTAYMDVLRDRSIVDLDRNNVKVLETNLESSSDQFQAGSLTRTDVAQSRARLEDGKARLASDGARLEASEQGYRRIVGRPAGLLDQPPPLPMMPDTADHAEAFALDSNPDIAAAAASVKAAAYDVSVARASRMPSVSVTAESTYNRYSYYLGQNGTFAGDASQVQATLSVPLYQGGLPGAQIRQAQDFQSAAIENQTATERQVVANTRAAFSSYLASLEVIHSSEEALKANTLALEGVQAEQGAGLRQVLDVLNAEQEKLNSQVQLVSAQHDAYVAGFQLLNAMGLVTYQRLGIEGGALYDPTVNYARARRSISDWSENPEPAPIARPVYGPSSIPANPPVTAPAN